MSDGPLWGGRLFDPTVSDEEWERAHEPDPDWPPEGCRVGRHGELIRCEYRRGHRDELRLECALCHRKVATIDALYGALGPEWGVDRRWFRRQIREQKIPTSHDETVRREMAGEDMSWWTEW
jgi:hypothetical protein